MLADWANRMFGDLAVAHLGLMTAADPSAVLHDVLEFSQVPGSRRTALMA